MALSLFAVSNGIRRRVTHISNGQSNQIFAVALIFTRVAQSTVAIKRSTRMQTLQYADFWMNVRLKVELDMRVALSDWIRHGEFTLRQILLEIFCALQTNKVNWCLRFQRLKANRLLNIHTKYDMYVNRIPHSTKHTKCMRRSKWKLQIQMYIYCLNSNRKSWGLLPTLSHEYMLCEERNDEKFKSNKIMNQATKLYTQKVQDDVIERSEMYTRLIFFVQLVEHVLKIR